MRETKPRQHLNLAMAIKKAAEKNVNSKGSDEGKDHQVGPEALEKQSMLDLTYGMDSNGIADFPCMEKIWKWTFENKLFVLPEDQPIVLTEPQHTTKKQRDEMAEIYFEGMKASKLWMQKCCVLGLQSEGRTTGMVADMGHSGLTITPVQEGYMLPNASSWSHMGGDFLTQQMRRNLLLKDTQFAADNPKWEGRHLSDLKDKWSSCCPSYEEQVSTVSENKEKVIILPDNSQIVLHDETIRTGECLFKPMMAEQDKLGVHEEIFRCIMACENEIRKEMWNNILVIGGSSLIKGLPIRLEKEMVSIAPSTVKVNILSPPDRKFSAWVGAAILSSMDAFQHMYVTKQEYFENREAIHLKCF